MKKIIVIGLGIVGAVTSYQLARKGVNVIMIDSREKGRSTFAAAGMLNPWTTRRRNNAWYQLAALGAKWYDQLIFQLTDDGETNFGYKIVGALHLLNDEVKLNELLTIVTKRRKTEESIGNITELDEKETYELLPYTKKEFRGVFISGVGRVNGALLVEALINGAKKHGAKQMIGKANLLVEKNKVLGIVVNGEKIFADCVLLANGIWMPQLFDQIGIKIPVTIRKGEIIHFQTNEPTESLPIVISPQNKYFLPFDEGKLLVGETFTKVNFTEKQIEPSASGVYTLLDEIFQVAPKLLDATITEIRTGFRPYTANSLPLFGQIPHIENLYAANGLGASGLSTGPMIGLQLAKLLTDEPLDVNIEDYSFKKIINENNRP